MKNNNTKKYYNCFSSNQFRYLVNKGIEPVALNYHKETGVKFYVFSNDLVLSRALIDYSKGR